jgi:hypothetical protein
MRNPLRSETEVFRAVLVVAVGAAAIIVLTQLTRPLFGALLLAVELAAGVWALWVRARPQPPQQDGAEVPREGG